MPTFSTITEKISTITQLRPRAIGEDVDIRSGLYLIRKGRVFELNDSEPACGLPSYASQYQGTHTNSFIYSRYFAIS